MSQFFRESETKSRDMELQTLMSLLSSKEPVDYQTRFERALRAQTGQLSEKDHENMQKEEEIMQAKILDAEKTKVYVNFFNKGALKLIKKSKYL